MFENALPTKARDILRKTASVIREGKFYLAGGSGLALQIGHRVSIDLDFFKDAPFNETLLFSNLKTKVQSCEQILVERHTLSIFLEGVRCSFYYYDVPLLFDRIRVGETDIAGWQDILAEKFKIVSQRGSKKDFYDIFYVIKTKGLTIEEAVAYLRGRFGSTDLNRYHVLRSLVYFEDAEEEPDPVLVAADLYNWEDIKTFFIENIREFERALLRSD